MIGSPNHLHLEHIRLGLEARVKVFTEKPVVTTEEQTFELMDVLKKYGPGQGYGRYGSPLLSTL